MKQTGLVLEGGGLRGVYTAGVLDTFLEEGIKIPYVIGVSAGVCNAVSYLSGQVGRSAAINIDHCSDKEYFSIRNLLRTGNIFSEDMLFRRMPDELYPFDHEAYEASGIRLVAGTTDCVSGQAVYYPLDTLRGNMDIVKASSWLPYVSRIVEYDSKKLLDGGIADPIPVRKSISDGNARNIIVLTRPHGYRKSPPKLTLHTKTIYRHYPRLCKLLENRHLLYNQTVQYAEQLERRGEALILRPTVSLGISRLERDPDKLRAAYQSGRDDAKKKLPRILRFLGRETSGVTT